MTIIDEADALVPAAQNAQLKTLEEPPSSSVFILVTSRCSQVRFGRLSPGDVATVLERDHKYAKRDALAVAERHSPAADSAHKVVRKATAEDAMVWLRRQHREQEAHHLALLKIRERGLDMMLTRVEHLNTEDAEDWQ